MSQRRAGIINRCPVCRINNDLCICSELHPLSKIKTNVSLVVHVSELKLTSNTAQFVKLLLPQNAEIFIRGRVFENFTPDEILKREGEPLFLFPSEDSITLDEKFLSENKGPFHLIVPDGNWNQAKRVRKREEAFKNMRAVKLPPGIHTEYQLRVAPQPEWVSTYESVAHALAVLEGESVRDEMMTFFRKWVKRTLYNRTGLSQYN